MLPQMDTKVSLAVKVLWKFISLICFRVYLEVKIHKNPTCFSRWSVRNNPDKVYQLEDYGMKISSRVPIEIEANPYDSFYLKTKKDRMGHILNMEEK